MNCQTNDIIDLAHSSGPRKPRFSSLKKSAALSKVVRAKLSKTLHSSTSMHTLEKEDDSSLKGDLATSVDEVPEEKSEQLNKIKQQKRKSKLCMLLWPKHSSGDAELV